jgi:hypothetical protein
MRPNILIRLRICDTEGSRMEATASGMTGAGEKRKAGNRVREVPLTEIQEKSTPINQNIRGRRETN